jgi:hypothetical protein
MKAMPPPAAIPTGTSKQASKSQANKPGTCSYSTSITWRHWHSSHVPGHPVIIDYRSSRIGCLYILSAGSNQQKSRQKEKETPGHFSPIFSSDLTEDDRPNIVISGDRTSKQTAQAVSDSSDNSPSTPARGSASAARGKRSTSFQSTAMDVDEPEESHRKESTNEEDDDDDDLGPSKKGKSRAKPKRRSPTKRDKKRTPAPICFRPS